MPVEVIVDRILQLGHAREGAAPDALRRNLCEEAFDEIEPGRTRRREVQLEARMLGQPRLHLGGLVRPVVIEHEMHREVSKHGSIDPLQKANELFRPMPRLAFADDESALHVKGCEKRGGPMTLVVVRHRCGPTALQRQARLRAVEGLDLACMGCSMSRHFGPVSLFDQRTVSSPRPATSSRCRAQVLSRLAAWRLPEGLGLDSVEHGSRPGWQTYADLLGFASRVRTDLGDLRPRDMIDLQSFLWVQGSDEYPD
jgi:hypothetical protein